MRRSDLFLIISLSLTAFLAGYFLIQGDSGSPKLNTGTILDKFDNNYPQTTHSTGSTGSQQATSSGQATNDRRQAEGNTPFLIADRKVTSITNSPDKKGILYFEKNTGKLFEFDYKNSQETAVSETILPNFISAIWSPAEREVISSFYSPGKTNFKYHSYQTSKTTSFDPNIRSVAFSPDGNLIAYFYASPDKTSSPEPVETDIAQTSIVEPNKIFIAQPDGSYSKKILDTRLDNISISWPTGEWIAFKTSGAEIFLLSPEGKLNRFLGPGTALGEKWSKTGKKMLYSAPSGDYVPEGSILYVKGLDSREERSLEIGGEASKCVWSIDDVNIYCALAKSPSADEIYRINVDTGLKKLLIDPEAKLKEMFLSSTEDHLFFINASDEKLYTTRLAP